jgi:hypothetical protein
MLQFLYAIVPYAVARWLLRDPAARLGGNWLSLGAVNLGSLLIWLSIFWEAWRSPLHALGYILLLLSLLAAAWQTGALTLLALRRAEAAFAPTAALALPSGGRAAKSTGMPSRLQGEPPAVASGD